MAPHILVQPDPWIVTTMSRIEVDCVKIQTGAVRTEYVVLMS